MMNKKKKMSLLKIFNKYRSLNNNLEEEKSPLILEENQKAKVRADQKLPQTQVRSQ